MKKASEDVFDLFFNNSIDLLCIADTDGNFCKLNSEWERTLGYSLPEMEGKPFIGFVHPEDINKTIEATSQLASNKVVSNFINRYRHKNGSYRWIEWRSFPSNGKIYAAAHDITGHIETQQALKQSEEKNAKFLQAFMCSPDMVSIVDCASNKFVDINEVFIKSSGYQRHEIIGKTSGELDLWVFPKDRDRVLELLHTDKHIKNFKTKHRNRWGEIRDCVITAETFEVNKEKNYLFFTRDVTTEKKAVEALARSEQKFSDFFYLSPNIIGVTRISDGKLLDINTTHQKLTGYSREEILGKTSVELKIWGSESERQKILEMLDKKEEVRNFEINIESKDGTLLPCFISSKKIVYNDEACVLFALTDISEKKKAEDALRESEHRLRSFIENSSEGVVIINESGIIEEWNKSAEFVTGIPREQIIGQNWEEAALLLNPHPSQAKKTRQHLRMRITDALQSGLIDLQPFDLKLIHQQSGKTKYLEEKMFTIKTDFGYSLAITVTDITDRKEAEELVDQERNTLRALVDNIPDITYVKDRESRFIITNKVLAKILNTTVENILGKTDFDFFPADLAQVFYDDEQRLIQTGIPIAGKEEIIFDQAGTPVVLLTTKLPLFDIEGNITGIVGTGHIITERKQYELALKKSEDLMKGITQNIPGLVFQFYADKDGKYGLNFISDRSLEYLGFDNKDLDLVYKGFIAGFVEEDRQRLITSIKDAVTSVSPWKYEGRYIKPDGSERIFRGASQPRMLEGTLVFDGLLFDITQSWKAEQELADARAILATAINQSPIPMVIVSIPDYIIRIANKASSEFLGVKDENEFVGKSFKDIHQTWLEFDEHGRPMPPNEMPLSLALKGIETKSKEYFVIRKDGTIRWESVSSSLVRNNKGETIAAFLLYPDITDRKLAEAVIIEKEAKIRSIFSAAPVAIGLTTNGEFQECNETFFRMTGYSSEEIIGKSARVIYPTEEDYLFIGREQINQMRDKRIDDVETRWICKDGRIISILLRFVPLDISDFSKGVTFSALDISERKEAEAEIVKLNEQLEEKVRERTNKLNEVIAELEAFAYSVSHDLRAPLRHIDGFVKLMYSKIPSPSAPIVDYYTKIEAASLRMSTMIDSLLSFSRTGRKELAISEVDLESLVYDVIDHLNPDIGNRKIKWNISHLPNLDCDKNLIKLVFENLISNAIKYTSKQPEAIIEIGSEKTSGNQIGLYIKDNGIGFDMAHANKLFGVFQRLHSSEEFEGIGIGLANVKQIIDKHKGSVRAEGKVNEGAVFYITLPKNQKNGKTT